MGEGVAGLAGVDLDPLAIRQRETREEGEQVKLKRGDVVVAMEYIADVDEHGDPYLHASPGTAGVVIGDEDPAFPNVKWGPHGHGVCNVPSEKILKTSTPVFFVVEFTP